MKLADRLMSDLNSGLKRTADGRLIFRPRRVEFETIHFEIEELLGKNWLHYKEELTPPLWQNRPSYLDIQTFAHLASERFIQFWYRVIDVALARALAGSGREIFQLPFMKGGPLPDIGIPDRQEFSSVPPELHEKILNEYQKSKKSKTEYKIFYLSDYLETLTDDLILTLSPCRELWDLKKKRSELLKFPGEIRLRLEEEHLKTGRPQKTEALLEWEKFIYASARSAATILGTIHRLELRRCRFRFLHSKFESATEPEGLGTQLQIASRRLKERLQILANQEKTLQQIGASPGFDIELPKLLTANIQDLKKIDEEIIKIYDRALAEEKGGNEVISEVEPASKLEIPEGCRVGNPFHEHLILEAARKTILMRLRPVRRTASVYSLVPEHFHGAMTLNPIMQLWKNRPNITREGEPEITSLEINTKKTIDCLIRLASLVDEDLPNRNIARGRIAGLKRDTENLETLRFFLLPGSCYPIREIHRLDFPEFRSRVIGETRNGKELGVSHDETAVLTGGWYKKENHCLYYPVGGDNGGLLQTIWRSARAPGPPAFFFALGQFVHDCLEDSLIYYKSGKKTFRECVEEYYKAEDKIQKNRGEKMGRRKNDNSRHGVRFVFSVYYSRLIMEALTGSSQSHFRHRPSELWMLENLNLPILALSDREQLREIRKKAREITIFVSSNYQ